MSERDALLKAIAENPEDTTLRGAFADWLDEHEEPKLAAELRRGDMLVDQTTRVAVHSLARCRLLPGSWEKRFIMSMDTRLTEPATPIKTISLKQWSWVWKLAWKYRRQIENPEVRQAAALARHWTGQMLEWAAEKINAAVKER